MDASRGCVKGCVMKRGAQILRRLSIFFLIANILLPLSMDAAIAQENPTGSVTIVLYSTDGGTVAGGTFELTTTSGPRTVHDGDDGAVDGSTTVYDVPVGNVSVRQTAGPDSHYLASGTDSGAVAVGGNTVLELSAAPVPPPDSDGDGIPDSSDPYPNGDPDTDGDGIADFNDTTPNGDNDGDGIDNLSDPYPNGDPDADADGIVDGVDNCVSVANADQADNDSDGQGNACETDDPSVIDSDGDGVVDASDICPADANADQLDTDGDGTGDVCDATPNGDVTPTPDPATVDTDSDGLTDAKEAELGTDPKVADTDADGVSDGDEITNGTDPNDPKDPAPSPADTDGDGVADDADTCVDVANTDQVDTDADGLGDACDTDDDNDTLSDEEEAKAGTDPLLSDTDSDGLTDAAEVNEHKTDPLLADTDKDGISDGDEIAAGTDPLVAEKTALTLTKTATQLNGTAVKGGVTAAKVDDVITYEIVATNAGTVPLSDVAIADELVGKSLTCDPAAPATLEPGAKMTCTATYTVTKKDEQAGQVVNTATATANDANGKAVEVAPASMTTTVGAATLKASNMTTLDDDRHQRQGELLRRRSDSVQPRKLHRYRRRRQRGPRGVAQRW